MYTSFNLKNVNANLDASDNAITDLNEPSSEMLTSKVKKVR